MPEPDKTTTAPLRWAGPVSASSQFTGEQQQRVQALRAAREVLETTGSSSVFSKGERTVPPYVTPLLELADFILTGLRVEVDAEAPGHRTIYNLGTGTITDAPGGPPSEPEATGPTMVNGPVVVNVPPGTSMDEVSEAVSKAIRENPPGAGVLVIPSTDESVAPYLHAKELDDTRLCGSSEMGTTFWQNVSCPACLAHITRREQRAREATNAGQEPPK